MKNIFLAALAATAIAAALPTGALADTACTVTVTKFNQSYPYSGRAMVEYTVGGTLPANAFAEITINTDDAGATFVQSNIVAGANSYVIDFASSFDGTLLLTNASFVVAINLNPGGNNLGGVQLWAGGPYWAECNVGASEPEEFGYYFWWGDTVGYTRSGGIWEESTSRFYDVTWVSRTGEQMDSSPFYTNSCPTIFKDYSTLQSEGWIDATTNLVAAHDAATAYLGTPWRMPTYDEIQALIDKCTTTWITNGVKGRLVTGTGAYANRSIFLPVAGYGIETNLYGVGSYGYYWSSTPHPGRLSYAWRLHFTSKSFSQQYSNYRYYGQPVRPVRGFAGCSAGGSVTYDPLPVTETQTTPVPVPYAWLDAHVPGVAYACEAYEAAAQATAANGRKVWECYALGLDPQVATNDFRIASFLMKADGTPDLANVVFDPPREQWNVPDAPVVWKGAATLEGPWRTVKAGGGSSGAARPATRFFKAVVFGDEDDIMVQLWEDGPYWAIMNVGAEEPWECGYYFWWGDTVGYTNTGSGWISVTDGTSISFTNSVPANSTYRKTVSWLRTNGYIDATTDNLVPEHDAAHVHWGDEWRMPTADEFDALVDNCTTTWTTTNGVAGYLVTGTGKYANRSIFLPAAGYGGDSQLNSPDSQGQYWSSTPHSSNTMGAFYLFLNSGGFGRGRFIRYNGQSVRPVRDAD